MKASYKREFKVFKKGRTTAWIWIMSKKGEPFNKDAKIKKYLSLGYQVKLK